MHINSFNVTNITINQILKHFVDIIITYISYKNAQTSDLYLPPLSPVYIPRLFQQETRADLEENYDDSSTRSGKNAYAGN
jgi:hypothetical protein